MFCTNCGSEVKEGLKFCTNCGFKLEEEEPQEVTPTPQIERTEVMTPVQPAVIQQEPKVYSATPTQSATQQIKEAKSSKAPTVVLIVATIIIVAGGALASLAIVQPPIEFLKDTPFSSVKSSSETSKKSDVKDDNAKEETKSDSADKKEDTSSSNKNNSNTSSSGSYVIKDSDTRRLTDSDIVSLTDDQICIANNEIWARHGRKFDNKWLQDYFNKQSWYKGTIEPSEFLSVYSPSQIENDNASFLMSTLNGRGYDVNKAHPN